MNIHFSYAEKHVTNNLCYKWYLKFVKRPKQKYSEILVNVVGNSWKCVLKRKVFSSVMLNIVYFFSGIRQWRMEAKFKTLVAEFERGSYKFIFNIFGGFTEMKLYPLVAKANKQHWRHFFCFSENRIVFGEKILFLLIFCRFSINIYQLKSINPKWMLSAVFLPK